MLHAGSKSPSTTCFTFLGSSSLTFQQAREPFPARRDGVQPLLLVRHPVVPKLALQPLRRARLDPVAVDQPRVVVRTQEEYRRVPRRRGRIGGTTMMMMPGDDAVEARGQAEAGEESERVADVDYGAVWARRDGLPC